MQGAHATGAGDGVRAPRGVATALVFAMLVVLSLSFQGTRPLFETDEGRYTAVALEMLDSGDFLLPRLNRHEEHLTKPPLTYWAIATSMAVFGRNTWAIRLPYALAFIATGALVLALGRLFVPQRPWLPAFVWGSSLLAVLAANVVTTDTFVALFETAAVYGWVRWSRSEADRRWLLWMWTAFGLAFMTKGPPTLLPLLPIATWTIATAGARASTRLLHPLGLAAFAVVGCSWFVWLLHGRPELLGYFLGYELVDRVFSGVHDRNAQWYGALRTYLPMLLLAGLPWAFVDVSWIGTLWRSRLPSEWRRRFANDPERAFLLLWVLMPLTVFFVAQSRLYLYVLPLAVPMALLVGRHLAPHLSPGREPFWRIALPAWVVVVFAIKAWSAGLTGDKDMRVQAQSLADVPFSGRILFHGRPAQHGLRLYTGVPVERVDRHPRFAARPIDPQQELCRDLREFPDALVIAAPHGARPALPTDCEGVALAQLSGERYVAVRSAGTRSETRPVDPRPASPWRTSR